MAFTICRSPVVNIRRFYCGNTLVWNNLMKQAESTVGYSTSFLNLRWLLSDEIANLASNVSKLYGTDHPLLKTVKKIITKSEMPSWGLIILLIAKAGGVNKKIPESERDNNAGILHTQRMVAEIIELIRTGVIFHKSLQLTSELNNITPDIHRGNKISLLIGDFMITKAFEIMAELDNSHIVEIISSALRDLSEAELIGDRDENNEPLPSQGYLEDGTVFNGDVYNISPFEYKKFMGKPTAEWALRNTLGGASLLGIGCLSAVNLGGHSKNLQEESYSFGVNLALICQARLDILSMKYSTKYLSKVAAPILFHMEYDRNFKFENMDMEELRNAIRNGPGVRKTEAILEKYKKNALKCLEYFPENEAKLNLHDITVNI
ncbi:hypothetical protein HHI36_012224 [Cryptolaemus montrouzieri]|uniref:Uncharacterized protein n=1 Tax=Cryptolaemus montrouzieri TaxID=559131 RepID=A0ABD2NDP7_9CUCU